MENDVDLCFVSVNITMNITVVMLTHPDESINCIMLPRIDSIQLQN